MRRRLLSVPIILVAMTLMSAADAGAGPSPDRGPTAGGTTVTLEAVSGAYSAVESGDDVTIGLTVGGDVYAWGSGEGGRLGTGSTASSAVPVPVDDSGVLAGRTVTQVSVRDRHVLVLTSDGTALTWGANEAGQLGDGTMTPSPSPVEVSTTGPLGGVRLTQVAAGFDHSVALSSDGRVFAWGANDFGQLGDGTTTGSLVPVAVDMTGSLVGKTITQVAAGFGHTLAVTSDGAVYSWGNGFWGELGNGATENSSAPVPVDMTDALSGKTVVQVSAGIIHSVALTSDGTVVSWGAGFYGQLGTGGTTGSSVPVPVDTTGPLAGSYVDQIATGNGQTVALTSDGVVVAWGEGYRGQLGTGTTDDTLAPLVTVTSGLGGGPISRVGAGADTSSAIAADGSVFTWGAGDAGQLGTGLTSDSSVPVAVVMPQVNVEFGDTAASAVARTSATTLQATTPPHPAGLVDVTVRAGGNAGYPEAVEVAPAAFMFGTEPVVVVEPSSTTTTARSEVTLTASADGDEAPAVGWEKFDEASQSWIPVTTFVASVEGARTGTILTVLAPEPGFSDTYRAVFSNPLGQVTTGAAVVRVELSVTPTPSPSVTPTSSPSSAPIPSSSAPGGGNAQRRELAATGVDLFWVIAATGTLALSGATLLSRRRRT